ncbi:reverse transcriptase family protein [Acetobacterium sp.]|uniref:reverse transcriptase family protein n=1 Tax=Acetobacterium sp. TaxID=1872094 RepID=UPI002F4199DB
MNRLWKIENEEQFYNNIVYKSKEDILAFISDPEKELYYKDIVKFKKKNGFREICIINKKSGIYDIQKNLKNNFLNNISISDVSYGFVKNCNYYDFLEPHINFYKNSFFLRLDVENFFGSIRYSDINDVMSYYFLDSFDIEKKREILEIICKVLTFHDKVIQGTPTAPVISNIIFRSLDIRIQKYCQKFGVIYSRYADDLLFSTHQKILMSSDFYKGIQNIIMSKNFMINHNKTIRYKNSISLNGYVVDCTIRLSRKKLKRLNRVLFYLENVKFRNEERWFENLNDEMKKYEKNEKVIAFSGKYEMVNFLAGNRSFLISSIRYSEDKLYLDRCIRMIHRIENQINNIL